MAGICAFAAPAHLDSRLHYLWACPVAAAVVAELSRVLGPRVELQRQHVWLLQSPTRRCVWHVWALVCFAAVHAMDRGRARLTRLRLEGEAAAAAGGQVQALPQPAMVAQVVPMAVHAFWHRLARMVADLQVAVFSEEAWAGEYDWGSPRHPFIARLEDRFELRGQPPLPWAPA